MRDDLQRVLCRRHGVANRARVLKELVVAAALGRLIAKEVDGRVLLRGQEVQAEGLIPSAWRAVDANLPADAKGERVGRAWAEALHELSKDTGTQTGDLVCRVEGGAWIRWAGAWSRRVVDEKRLRRGLSQGVEIKGVEIKGELVCPSR